jgi:hypothetical protein
MNTYRVARVLRRLLAGLALCAISAGVAACGATARPQVSQNLPAPAGPSGAALPTTAGTAAGPQPPAVTHAPATAPAGGSDRRIPAPIPPSRLPHQEVAHWRATGTLVAMPLSAEHRVSLNECANAPGVTAWHEQAYVSAQHTPAQEDILSFPDAAGAATAATAIQSGMRDCQATSQNLQRGSALAADARVTRTARNEAGAAWSRTWNAVAGLSAAGPQVNHYYLIRHGSTVVVAAFTEFGASRPDGYDAAGDPAVLAMLAADAAS